MPRHSPSADGDSRSGGDADPRSRDDGWRDTAAERTRSGCRNPPTRSRSAEPPSGADALDPVLPAASDETAAGDGATPSPIPALDADEAIRFHDPGGSIRFLWQTDEATARPFVGVLAGTDGSRYPLYLDRETVATRCRAAFSVVAIDSIPIDPPPHVRVPSGAIGSGSSAPGPAVRD